LSVLFFCAGVCIGGEYDRLLKEYKKEIGAKAENLDRLKDEISRKKAEKKKYEKKENAIKGEVTRLESEIDKINSNIRKTQNEIKNIDKRLNETVSKLQTSFLEIAHLQSILKKELDYLYRRHYCSAQIFDDTWTKELRECSVEEKAGRMLLSNKKTSDYEFSLKKYSETQTELLNVKKVIVKKWNKQKKSFDKRNKELKTVRKSRTSIENEIIELNNTAGELKDLVYRLEKKKRKTLELKQDEELAKKKFNEKKLCLPWPVEGKLVAGFGKAKHPGLDTYIISNGIKIETREDSIIKVIDRGEIVYADNFRSYGKTVIVSHGGGFYTIYGQLGEILVKNKKKISGSEPIGKMERGENILYFEIRSDNKPLDPLVWLRKTY
jgi:septal ring factor EnvC (AmiA/AmiB activator)